MTLKNVLVNLKRAISKLKIELHADYLTLGSLNIDCQSSRESRDAQPQQAFDHNYGTMGQIVPNNDYNEKNERNDTNQLYQFNNQLQSIFGRIESSQQTSQASQAVSGAQSISSYKHNHNAPGHK